MLLSKKIRLAVGITGAILPVVTLFIPFYETVLMQDQTTFPGIVHTYTVNEFEIAVVSGLGSLYAYINIPFCIFLSVLLLINQPNLIAVIFLGVLFIITSCFVQLGCSAGFGKPFADSMLIGYRLLWITELVLLVISRILILNQKKLRSKKLPDF